MNDLVPTNAEIWRTTTDAAGLCGEIVKRTAKPIQGKRYICAEGWQAIAVAHGCVAGARDVEPIEGGVRAIGELRKVQDGVLIATAEGFVGDDESTWAKRPLYARRAMAQTRAISRVCRSAFAHVAVLIDAGLSTTPAEEVPLGGFEPEEPDHRVINPDTGRKINPQSANQARKDGRGERAAKLAHEMHEQDTVTGALAWKESVEAEVGTWPASWQFKFSADFETHLADLKAQAAAMFGADDDGVVQSQRGTLEPVS